MYPTLKYVITVILITFMTVAFGEFSLTNNTSGTLSNITIWEAKDVNAPLNSICNREHVKDPSIKRWKRLKLHQKNTIHITTDYKRLCFEFFYFGTRYNYVSTMLDSEKNNCVITIEDNDNLSLKATSSHCSNNVTLKEEQNTISQ